MSKLTSALNNLGFKSKATHHALITNIYLAGYFKEWPIWQAINLIDHRHPENIYAKKSKIVFSYLYQVIQKSKASQDNPELFKPNILLKNLFAEEIFENQDVEDFLVYLICQNAFGRIKNQERNEIADQNWMINFQHQYLENAGTLGLINEIKPKFLDYDESWLMGAARFRSITRIKHLKKIQEQGINIGKIRLLSGNRELWVEIDNINGNIDEAKDYMIKLAKENNIKIHKTQNFIVRNVAGHQRTYLNYDAKEKKKLTETLMIKTIYNDIFGNNQASIIDDCSTENFRPTTESTVETLINDIFKRRLEQGNLKGKEKVAIMIISNQPYCERQRLTTQRVAFRTISKQLNKKLIFDEIGEESHTSISNVHSELSALIAEKFWQYTKKTSQTTKRNRPPQKMIFSTKHHDTSFIPPIPKVH